MATIEEKREIALQFLRNSRDISAEHKQKTGDKMNFTEVVNEMEARGLLDKLIIERERIVYEKTPFKTSDEVRAYKKYWRENQKKLMEEKDRDIRNQVRIENALEREKAFCYKCQKQIKVIEPTYKIVDKAHKKEMKKMIMILARCPDCGWITRSYGGFIE